jgi:hypothetical protein
MAGRRSNLYPLRGTVPEFHVHPPSVGREVNQSRPSERDPRISNQRFLMSPHSMQDMHVEGLKLLYRAVSGHKASYRLSRLNLYMTLAYAMVRPHP